jgi:hypothetical protein
VQLGLLRLSLQGVGEQLRHLLLLLLLLELQLLMYCLPLLLYCLLLELMSC